MEKINTYLLIVVLIVVVAVLYFVYNNKKEVSSQSDLLLAMAKKIGTQPVHKQAESNEPPEETEEDGFEIVRIAEKLYRHEPLTAKEKKFQSLFQNQIEEELAYCNQFYPLVKKFVDGVTEFTDAEKEFYDNNSSAIEAELNRIKESSNPDNSPTHQLTNSPTLSGGNPPLAQGERLKVILGFFEDGIPKTVTDISSLYAQKTGTAPSKGNMSTIFGKLEGKELMCEEIKHNSRWKIFYGLPEWFDGKKLKKEYKQKIA